MQLNNIRTLKMVFCNMINKFDSVHSIFNKVERSLQNEFFMKNIFHLKSTLQHPKSFIIFLIYRVIFLIKYLQSIKNELYTQKCPPRDFHSLILNRLSYVFS